MAQRTAKAEAMVSYGFVISVTVTDGGAGYVAAPAVNFKGGGGSGAAATAIVSNGAVVAVYVTSAGIDYASAPTVVISPPPNSTPITIHVVSVIGNDGQRINLLSTNVVVTNSGWPALLNDMALGSNGGVFVDYDGVVTQRYYRAVVAMDFAQIPAGSFSMGDSFTEGGTNELPRHTVTLNAFKIEKNEVSKGTWDKVYAWAGSHLYSFDNAGSGRAANEPVQVISWHDAVKWCNARSEMEGLTPAYYSSTSFASNTVYRSGKVTVLNTWVNWSAGYRLPTEAEWEYAARGGLIGKRFAWGDTIAHAQADYNSDGLVTYDVSATRGYNPLFLAAGTPYTCPANSLVANGYGLYGMIGNVGEWCWDWMGPYSSANQSNPRGPDTGANRILRGGNWNTTAQFCRVACRSSSYPDFKANTLGFRTVLPSN